MADTDALDTMEHLVAALRKHIAQEEGGATTQSRGVARDAGSHDATTMGPYRRVSATSARRGRSRRPPRRAPLTTGGLSSKRTPCPQPCTRLTESTPRCRTTRVPQDAARSSRAREEEASDSPQHGSQDRLEALEASLRLLHTEVDALLGHLERQA